MTNGNSKAYPFRNGISMKDLILYGNPANNRNWRPHSQCLIYNHCKILELSYVLQINKSEDGKVNTEVDCYWWQNVMLIPTTSVVGVLPQYLVTCHPRLYQFHQQLSSQPPGADLTHRIATIRYKNKSLTRLYIRITNLK